MSAHSDKALKTIAAMGTTPEAWKLAPIKFVWEKHWIPGMVRCPDCLGGRYVKLDAAGAVIPPPDPKERGRGPAFTTPHAAYVEEARNLHRAAHPDDRRRGNCSRCRSTKRGWGYGDSTGEVPGMVEVEGWVGHVQWPKDTAFDSRFAHNDCNLCAKRIPSREFVPVLGVDATGQAHGMWVGRDCGRRFFGAEVSYEVDGKPVPSRMHRPDRAHKVA